MSLPAARPLVRPNHPLLQNGTESTGVAKAPAACVPSTDSVNKITKARWTSKRTHRQFLPKSYRESLESKRQDVEKPAAAPETANLIGALGTTVGLVATSALTAAARLDEQSRQSQAQAPGPPGGEHAPGDEATPPLSLSCLQTKEPPERPRDLSSVSSMEDVTMSSDTGYTAGAAPCPLNTSTNGDHVPRSFERADIVIPSDGRDKERSAHAPVFRAQVAPMAEGLPALRPPYTGTNHGAQEKAASVAKTEEVMRRKQKKKAKPRPQPSSSRLQPPSSRPQPPSSRIGHGHEVIYISDSDDNACLPIRPSTLEASSREMPTKEPKVSEQSITVASITSCRAASAESSDDDIPLAQLRQRRLSNKHRRRANETQFALVNKPMPAIRPRTVSNRPKQKLFDSNTFDAMIYSQSSLRPPRGVSTSRPTTSSSSAGIDDDKTIYVYANPAIHRPLVRSEQWWKDKAHEIRGRPNRKKWFGKVTQRLRWLHEQELQDEMRRRPRTRGSAGRSPRRDPQAAGYRRVMDFGDIPEHQLPLYVQNNPAWVKACMWMRQTKEREEVVQRVIEHGSQVIWQNYDKFWSGEE